MISNWKNIQTEKQELMENIKREVNNVEILYDENKKFIYQWICAFCMIFLLCVLTYILWSCLEYFEAEVPRDITIVTDDEEIKKKNS